MNAENKIIINAFTDPLCTWCWGSEPIYRKLQSHFGDNIEFRPVMGGLVEDLANFRDVKNDIGGRSMADSNRDIANHWAEAAARHGMPVDSENFNLFDDEHRSTYPQNIAYKAVQLADPGKAEIFMYNLRVASAAQARLTNLESVLIEIADESGVDIPTFLRKLRDGTAEQAFRGDLALTRHLGVHGFPTCLIKFNNQQIMLRGYRDFDTFVSIIDSLSQGAIKPIAPAQTAEALLDFMANHPKMAIAEVREAFNFATLQDAENFVVPLIENGTLQKEIAGSSYFVVKPNLAGACDLTTRDCG